LPPSEPISTFKVVTGEDGKVRLRLPAKVPLTEWCAWHPTLGATGVRDLKSAPRLGRTELSLLSPAPHTIHVIDVDGHGIGGLELGVYFPPGGHRLDRPENTSKRRMYERPPIGTAIVPWAPPRETPIRRSRHSWFRLEG